MKLWLLTFVALGQIAYADSVRSRTLTCEGSTSFSVTAGENGYDVHLAHRAVMDSLSLAALRAQFPNLPDEIVVKMAAEAKAARAGEEQLGACAHLHECQFNAPGAPSLVTCSSDRPAATILTVKLEGTLYRATCSTTVLDEVRGPLARLKRAVTNTQAFFIAIAPASCHLR